MNIFSESNLEMLGSFAPETRRRSAMAAGVVLANDFTEAGAIRQAGKKSFAIEWRTDRANRFAPYLSTIHSRASGLLNTGSGAVSDAFF